MRLMVVSIKPNEGTCKEMLERRSVDHSFHDIAHVIASMMILQSETPKQPNVTEEESTLSGSILSATIDRDYSQMLK